MDQKRFIECTGPLDLPQMGGVKAIQILTITKPAFSKVGRAGFAFC
jgi:hypothetical protein